MLALSLVLAGLLGSLHCAAMCGPFATAAARRGLAASALYTAGRLTAYGTLGAVAGLLGAGLHASLADLTFASAATALLAGLGMVVLGLWSLRAPRPGRVGSAGPLSLVYVRLVPLVRACLEARRKEEAYLLGVLNGLLPCPLVTPMLLASLASGSAATGSALLLGLGLGTVPAMLTAGHVGSRALVWLGRGSRSAGDREASRRLRAWAPGLALLALGLLTAARPFLSVGSGSLGHLH
jgi:sulfite exporter TauE/SafE